MSASACRDIPVEDLTEAQAAEELAALASELADLDRAYYQDDAPTLSDADYDALRRRNADIEARFPGLVREDSPSIRVGAAPASGFAKVVHAKPMLSLGNAFNEGDLRDFVDGVRRFLKELRDDPSIPLEMMAEPKIDGLSVSLRYERGRFVQGATRGDGTTGEDVTTNLRTLGDVPERMDGVSGVVPDIVEVRGEVYMTKPDFSDLNAAPASQAGGKVFANPRNAAAGSLRQLDSGDDRPKAPCGFSPTLGARSASRSPTTHQRFSGRGSRPPRFPRQPAGPKLCRDIGRGHAGLLPSNSTGTRAESATTISTASSSRSIASTGRRRLGSVSRAPRWAIAQKFEAEKAADPDCACHPHPGGPDRNADAGGGTRAGHRRWCRRVPGDAAQRGRDFERKNVRVGDTVVVQRAGDVIPQVVSVVLDKRPPGTQRALCISPTAVPECGSLAIREDRARWRAVAPVG